MSHTVHFFGTLYRDYRKAGKSVWYSVKWAWIWNGR